LEVKENLKNFQSQIHDYKSSQLVSEKSLTLKTLFFKNRSVDTQTNHPKKIVINSAQIIKKELFKP
jgi:hypothetical protein